MRSLAVVFGMLLLLSVAPNTDAKSHWRGGYPLKNKALRVPLANDCACSSGRYCVGPRGGRYCITVRGNKRYL